MRKPLIQGGGGLAGALLVLSTCILTTSQNQQHVLSSEHELKHFSISSEREIFVGGTNILYQVCMLLRDKKLKGETIRMKIHVGEFFGGRYVARFRPDIP